jgi:two-component system, OmpR family, KDP operon response regulator KdpE
LQLTSDTRGDVILLVDPDPCGFKAVAGILTARGYTVRSAASQLAALGSIGQDPPDVVIVKVGDYDIAVLEVCSSFAQSKPNLPLIVLGPRIEGREKARVFAVGASDYVELPFDTGELIARIRSAIRRASR